MGIIEVLEIINWIVVEMYMILVFNNLYNMYVKGKMPNYKMLFIGDTIVAVDIFIMICVGIYRQDYADIIMGVPICAYISYKAYKAYVYVYK